MTEIQKKILEIEDGFKELSKLAGSIEAERYGYVQQKAILGLRKSLNGIWGWDIGELKNAFGIGEQHKKKYWPQNAQKTQKTGI